MFQVRPEYDGIQQGQSASKPCKANWRSGRSMHLGVCISRTLARRGRLETQERGEKGNLPVQFTTTRRKKEQQTRGGASRVLANALHLSVSVDHGSDQGGLTARKEKRSTSGKKSNRKEGTVLLDRLERCLKSGQVSSPVKSSLNLQSEKHLDERTEALPAAAPGKRRRGRLKKSSSSARQSSLPFLPE